MLCAAPCNIFTAVSYTHLAERAWSIPFRIKEIVGSFNIDDLASISLEEYKNIFNRNILHRFNEIMAEVFYSAVQDIKVKYNGCLLYTS